LKTNKEEHHYSTQLKNDNQIVTDGVRASFYQLPVFAIFL